MSERPAEKHAPAIKLRTYWRIEAQKKLRRQYRKGWTVAHMSADNDRIVVLLTRFTPPDNQERCG